MALAASSTVSKSARNVATSTVSRLLDVKVGQWVSQDPTLTSQRSSSPSGAS